MTNNPKSNSYPTILRLYTIGSIIAAKNAPVDIMARATETVDTFIAKKKVTQCKATIMPAKVNHNKVLVFTRSVNFEKRMYTRMNRDANPIRYQTNGKESREISFPRIAVKP